MQIDAIAHDPMPTLASVERAHAALNAAYNALTVDSRPSDVGLAQRYVREARTELTGHDGPADATAAARAVLPKLEHALQLLEALGASRDPLHVGPLLDDLGSAMDHVEAVLASVGWE